MFLEGINKNRNHSREAIVERWYLTIDFWLWFNGVFFNDWFLALHQTTCGNYNICLSLKVVFYGFLEYVSLLIHSFPNIFYSKIILYNENAFVQCPLHKLLFFFFYQPDGITIFNLICKIIYSICYQNFFVISNFYAF